MRLTPLQAVIHKVQKPPYFGYVTYEIHLHPTYQAPCLWFSLHGLPMDEPAFSVDTVFRRLVPDQYKDGLRKVGNIGGISADVSGFSRCKYVNFRPSMSRFRLVQVYTNTLK